MALLPLSPDDAAFGDLKVALEDANLPTGDLLEDGASYFLWETPEGHAFAGLVPLGDDALLRSVTVPLSERSAGLGRAVVAAVAEAAATAGVKRLWLLTTTADKFFAAQGWETVDRQTAPRHVSGSRQFSGVCPSSATLMVRPLA